MTKTQSTPTKAMFDCLVKLYKQGQLLLLDADHIMGERGWERTTSTIVSGLSYSISNPERWYLRWATRFYLPIIPEEEEAAIDRIPLISIHFAADHDTKVDDPIVSAGWLLYSKTMNVEEARQNYDYWMCKYWFYGQPHDSLKGWHKTGQSEWYDNLKGSETFTVPLYEINSSEKLEKLVIEPLLSLYEAKE